jgi:hypothetical protein
VSFIFAIVFLILPSIISPLMNCGIIVFCVVQHFRFFGSPCYALIPKQQRDKLGARSHKCLFLGYSNTSRAYCEPNCFEEAANCDEWKDAMQKEYDALIKNGTWRLVDPPYRCQTHWLQMGV